MPERPLNRHDCPECDEADRKSGGRTWSDVADGFPSECHAAFCLHRPEARRYYLPAFLLSAFGSRGMQSESLESALTDGTFSPESFTPPQRAAVGRWVVEFWGSWMGWEESPPHLSEWWPEAGV